MGRVRAVAALQRARLDAPVQGGREHDWTLGANWYLTTHFKVQLNVVRAWSDRGGSSLDPRIFEARVS
ncbi:MAG: porin [Lysobacterales bacterium]